MADKRTHQIMATLRGDRSEQRAEEAPKLTGAAAEIHGKLRGMNAGSVPPAKRPEESKARFEQMVRDIQLKNGLSRADAETAARWALRREAQEAERRGHHEAMVRRNRAEPERALTEAVTDATRRRVQRLPNGNPVPGTTVNDLIQDGARNTMVEKLRVQALGGWDALVEAGLVDADEEQQAREDAALVAKLRNIADGVATA
ncbi:MULTISPECIES: hypothetical protein [unclassified Streptomyces]|uniref:hypothetical protein n=1 Tax=unclassified Streptomyces TaxID=2593676 RepID=UPI0036E1492D